MRSYGQFCSVAKALDAIGDRWNLLIVRELLLRGRCRYTDLLGGLPGIATNLLADRLRDLERVGIVTREEAPPPIATTLFGLTEWGEQLKPVLRELGLWGAPLMSMPADDDAFRAHWLALPAELYLSDSAPDEQPVSIELRLGDETATLAISGGEVRALSGATESPDLVLSGAPQVVLGLLSGMLTLAQARSRGLEHRGTLATLRRVRPREPAAAALRGAAGAPA